MAVIVRQVSSRRELRQFVKFPLELYKDCPYYIPGLFLDEMNALDERRNPMSKYSKSAKFLAYKDGIIVGRVAAIINEIANRNWNQSEVHFGWIDFIDDMEVSAALIEAVEAFGRQFGMTKIVGPLGFTDFDNEGCVVEGFENISSFALKFNYSYYGKHFEALGMGKENDWIEYRIKVPDSVPDKVSRSALVVSERYGLKVRKITKRQVRKENYGQKIFDLINRTYCKLYNFTILPPEVIDSYVETYLGLLDLKFVTLVEDREGKLVGVAIAMPSITHAVQRSRGRLFPLGWFRLLRSMYFHYEEGLELLLIGVDPAYRNQGVNALIFNDFIPNVIKGGFKYAETNAEMETNTSVQNLWNIYDKQLMRRRRVFGKAL